MVKINFNDWVEMDKIPLNYLDKNTYNNLIEGDMLHCYKNGYINLDEDIFCIKDKFYEVKYGTEYNEITIIDERGFEHLMDYEFTIKYFDYVK